MKLKKESRGQETECMINTASIAQYPFFPSFSAGP